METVVVTGIRGSLQRNLDIKRDSLGLVDAITMEDIGKFPDANLANALMRIPGVTMSMTANSTNNGQATTTGQGVSITVRGFGPTYNETLFDGRFIPSANSVTGVTTGGRSFDFSGLSADMVARLEVLKSPDAAMSAGAIGASINVIYPKPFDKPGFTAVASASGSINTDDGRWMPNGNFLISDTFAGDKIGFLVAGSYSSFQTSQWQVQNWGWNGSYLAPCQMSGYTGPDCSTMSDDATKANYDKRAVADTSKPVWWTQDYAVDWNQINEERINLRAVGQFRPTQALEITLDGNFARDDLMQDSLTYALWNSVGDMRNVSLSKNGTAMAFTRSGPQDFDDVRSQQIQQTYNWGINFKYNVNDHVTIIADYSQALSALNPNGRDHLQEVSAGIGYGPSGPGGIYGSAYTVTQAGGHNLPYYSGVGPSGDASKFTGINTGLTPDGSILGSHVMVVNNRNNTYLVNQARLEGNVEYGDLKIKAGAQYQPNHFITRSYTDLFGGSNNNWQVVSGYGPDSHNKLDSGSDAGYHLPASLFHGVKTMKPDSIPGWTAPSGGVIPGLPITNAYDVYSYLNSKTGTSITCPYTLDAKGNKVWGFPTPNGVNCGALTDPAGFHGMIPALMPDESKSQYQKLFEDNYAFYVSFASTAKVGDMPLKINGGLRWEYTDMTASGFGTELKDMVITPGDLTAYNFILTTPKDVSVKNTYSYLLPNLDLTLNVTDDFHLRFDGSRTMTRAPIANLTATVSYGGRKGSLTATGGNPNLLPFLSDNLDVAAEWYYAGNSYLSADVFLKNVSNFVINGTSTKVVTGVIDPNTGNNPVFTLNSVINGPSANVYGLELAWQHTFGDSGFGYLLNGTIVQSDRPYDAHNLLVSNFAVAGLADSANFTVFYDKDGIELRFAANWRDTYLDRFGQGQGNGMFGTEPVFVNGNWDLSLSGGYDITDNLKAYFTASNLTNNSYSTRGRFADQVYGVISLGRSYTAGVHFKL
ncbi:TonB-dependent receptor [Rhizomicrobium palustre]|uniref:TonB-dependent receptor n=1 Tax=Rhizomicrobium palustre TaxID=189966 RepID=A0A846N0X5_9PROT|nr:TonB-dependent receptor [Rhizomicrobium palustre]NIK88991.1 TonB-dependent receptor [Rhizomicrobium palustre]